MGFLFLIHLIILIVYLVFKGLSFANPKNSLFRNFIQMAEYSGLVGFFLFFHMIVWVFTFYNLKQHEGSHSYHIFSLILAIAYLVFTIVAIGFFMYRLFGPGLYFMSDKNI